MILAAVDPSVLIGGLILAVINVAIGIAVGVNSYLLKRLVEGNDREHREARTERIELTRALAAEKDARHAAIGQVTSSLAEVREDRPRREEVIGQYAALVQKIGDVAERVSELSGRIEGGGRGGSQ